jgi:hypothetical protein
MSSSSSSSAGPELITSGEIDAIYNSSNKTLSNSAGLTALQTKVTNNAPKFRRSHVIQTSEFHTVYFSSDIHADVRKYIQMLRAVKLAGMADPIVEPYPADTIYDSRIVSDVTWTGGSGVLLVIIGDLVDGKRREGMEVNDPCGSFEVILLSYLYNLRIKAREAGSEILYTIGNHDYHTVISTDNDLNIYVHTTARKFFDDKSIFPNTNRRNALRPFYLANPYFMLSFMNGSTKEMACVHGGFHSINTKKSYTEAVETYQTTVDSETSASLLPKLQRVIKDIVDISNDDGVLWTKTYAKKTEGACNVFKPEDYPFIVVGHCPTTQNNRPLKLMYEGRAGKYEGCSITDNFIFELDEYAKPDTVYEITDTTSGKFFKEKGVGCIVTDCDTDHGPRLAYVDTALSEAFRFPTGDSLVKRENVGRFAQFLRLTHVESSIGRYYNKIESVTTNPDNTTVVLYSPPTSSAAASSTSSRKRSRTRRSKRTRQRRRSRRA